jgi:hypothetical protein
MVQLSLCLLAVTVGQPDGGIDYPTMARLIREASAFESVSLLCEGQISRWKSEAVGGEPSERTNFQSFYAYRSDRSAYLDSFLCSPANPAATNHHTYSIFEKKFTTLSHFAGRPDAAVRPSVSRATSFSLWIEHSPDRFCNSGIYWA